MRRAIITWSVAAAVVLASFAGTVLILNASLYSAGGFVRSYLDSLVRHDADGALELADIGSTAVAGLASRELLAPAAMGELSDIHLVSDVEAGGVHRVTYTYTADGVEGTSTFEVERAGTLLGLFPTWKFATSPLAVIQLSVLHATDFTVNGVDLSAAEQDLASPYLVFTPGTYSFSHDSKYLHAAPLPVTVTHPSGSTVAALDVQANSTFVDAVQDEVNGYLDDTCVPQQVLLPAGCPFGQEIANRTVSAPQWSMSQYPQVTLQPGPEPASWLMPPTEGAAHLVVDVQSLFDGSISAFDDDVPFTASYLVTFLPDGRLLVTGRYE
jgi:hypothetical protein